MIFDKMVDRSVMDDGVHGVRSGEASERLPKRFDGLPRWRSDRSPHPNGRRLWEHGFGNHICLLALCSHMLLKRDRDFDN